MRTIALGCALMLGCAAGPPNELQSTCRMLQASRETLPRLTPRELAQLSVGTPAHGDAESAYAQQLALITLGSIGAAALLSGLIMGFATDTSQPDVRTAGYGLVGGALGTFVIALVLGKTSSAAAGRAREWLLRWSERCQ
ncbi:MAG TPA: hypothetical protein VFF06_20865 [Polyangia bacterium]|nr:hypothetical protein [Polyangia bacterium]